MFIRFVAATAIEVLTIIMTYMKFVATTDVVTFTIGMTYMFISFVAATDAIMFYHQFCSCYRFGNVYHSNDLHQICSCDRYNNVLPSDL